MNLHREFSRIVREFQRRKVRFAVVGGLAMAFHDEPRFTHDIDLLVHSEDQDAMSHALLKLGYFESAKPWNVTKVPITLRRFARTQGEEFLSLDILIGRQDAVDRMVLDAEEQPWAKGTVRVARKRDIIALKKGRGSDQDKIDIKRLKK